MVNVSQSVRSEDGSFEISTDRRVTMLELSGSVSLSGKTGPFSAWSSDEIRNDEILERSGAGESVACLAQAFVIGDTSATPAKTETRHVRRAHT